MPITAVAQEFSRKELLSQTKDSFLILSIYHEEIVLLFFKTKEILFHFHKFS
ncbi:hypothetical protein D922_00781 [Enterococcus faecalis 06-MB-DW-09]|nr:hypothetical protein D922_00781 [Enterococcus faecalis 06-MB-DW-09]